MKRNLKDNLLKHNIVNMKFKGLLAGSISLNGYSPDILKSGIEIYNRRGESEKCEWCAVELDLFSECGGEPIRTNNINRLIVITSEDIGIAGPNLPIYVGQLVREWEINRNNATKKDRTALLKLVKMINNSPKSRLLNDIKATYDEGVDNQIITNTTSFQDLYKTMADLPEAAAGIWEMSSEKDDDRLLPLMDGLVYHLDNQDDRAFYYMFRILKLHEKKKRCAQRFRGWQPTSYKLEKPLGGRFQPEYAIWEHLFMRIEGIPKLANIFDVLFDWYCNKSDPWLYLTQAMLYFLREYDLDNDPLIPEITIEECDLIYDKNYNNPLILDSYVDNKTSKIIKKTSLHNIDVTEDKTTDKENNNTENENTELLNKTYRNIYNLLESETLHKSGKSTTNRKPYKKSKNNNQTNLDETTIELVEDPIPL